MDQTSITAAGTIDTFLVLLIGIGPKLALVPSVESPRDRPGLRAPPMTQQMSARVTRMGGWQITGDAVR
jgi:hypothetical protein